MFTELHRMSAAGNAFFLSMTMAAAEASRFAPRLVGRCEGLILGSVDPPTMRMFNPDGSEAMCGNGLRCLAKLLRDRGKLEDGGEILTIDGPKRIHFEGNFVEAEMGLARPLPDFGENPCEKSRLEVAGSTVEGYAVFVGNPHWVIAAEASHLDRFSELGPMLEKHRRFPEGANIEFAEYVKGGARVRVWERGVGETRSCGTGALAVASVGPNPILPGESRVIRYPGGALRVRADRKAVLHLGGPVRDEGIWEWKEGAILQAGQKEKA